MTLTITHIRHVEATVVPGGPDQQLVDRFLTGNETAFTELVTKYRRQVYAVAYGFTRNHEEADDLAQETFIRAYRGLKKFRGEASFKSWLLRITTNLSINYTKSGRISKDSGKTPDEQGETLAPQALEELLEDERNRQLRRAILKLPPKQKAALVLKTYRHLTCEQVAQIMQCSVGTVKANIFNAVKRLKTILNPGSK